MHHGLERNPSWHIRRRAGFFRGEFRNYTLPPLWNYNPEPKTIKLQSSSPGEILTEEGKNNLERREIKFLTEISPRSNESNFTWEIRDRKRDLYFASREARNIRSLFIKKRSAVGKLIKLERINKIGEKIWFDQWKWEYKWRVRSFLNVEFQIRGYSSSGNRSHDGLPSSITSPREWLHTYTHTHTHTHTCARRGSSRDSECFVWGYVGRRPGQFWQTIR